MCRNRYLDMAASLTWCILHYSPASHYNFAAWCSTGSAQWSHQGFFLLKTAGIKVKVNQNSKVVGHKTKTMSCKMLVRRELQDISLLVCHYEQHLPQYA